MTDDNLRDVFTMIFAQRGFLNIQAHNKDFATPEEYRRILPHIAKCEKNNILTAVKEVSEYYDQELAEVDTDICKLIDKIVLSGVKHMNLNAVFQLYERLYPFYVKWREKEIEKRARNLEVLRTLDEEAQNIIELVYFYDFNMYDAIHGALQKQGDTIIITKEIESCLFKIKLYRCSNAEQIAEIGDSTLYIDRLEQTMEGYVLDIYDDMMNMQCQIICQDIISDYVFNNYYNQFLSSEDRIVYNITNMLETIADKKKILGIESLNNDEKELLIGLSFFKYVGNFNMLIDNMEMLEESIAFIDGKCNVLYNCLKCYQIAYQSCSLETEKMMKERLYRANKEFVNHAGDYPFVRDIFKKLEYATQGFATQVQFCIPRFDELKDEVSCLLAENGFLGKYPYFTRKTQTGEDYIQFGFTYNFTGIYQHDGQQDIGIDFGKRNFDGKKVQAFRANEDNQTGKFLVTNWAYFACEGTWDKLCNQVQIYLNGVVATLDKRCPPKEFFEDKLVCEQCVKRYPRVLLVIIWVIITSGVFTSAVCMFSSLIDATIVSWYHWGVMLLIYIILGVCFWYYIGYKKRYPTLLYRYK